MSFFVDHDNWEMTNQRMLFPDPAMQIGDHQVLNSKDKRNLRFPWIQRRGPIDIQPFNFLPWKNHLAVPS